MNVIRIGIVDDESAAREDLRGALARYEAEYGTRFEVCEFDCAAAYLSAKNAACDILYLDIDMPGMSGMELAEKIRSADDDVVIIFCTNLQQFALNGYSVSALGFLIKPVQWYSFHLFLARALKAVERKAALQAGGAGRSIVIKDGPVSRIVKAEDIRYVEVRRHYLLYNITERETGKQSVIQTRGTMQDAALQLSRYGFMRCSTSFLVNPACVTAVERLDVHIGQEVLRIGRTYKESFTREFSKYLAKRGWEEP